MAPWLSERLGQQFVVDNRPGGRGNIGTEAVVKASPDGYTILLASSTNAINAALYDRLNFVVVCSKRFWIPTRPRIGSPKVYPLTPLQRGVISVDEATAAANVLQKFLDVFEKARRLGRGLSPIEESQ